MEKADDLVPLFELPADERLAAALKTLATIEPYFMPDDVVDACEYVRFVIARGHTPAEAMWAVFGQIQAGRYEAVSYKEAAGLQKAKADGWTRDTIYDYNRPAGLDTVRGWLNIPSKGVDWAWLFLKLPTSGLGKVVGDSDKAEASGQIPLEHRTRIMTKSEAARLINGGHTPSNPSEYIKGLIAKGILTTPAGEGQQWQFDKRQIPNYSET